MQFPVSDPGISVPDPSPVSVDQSDLGQIQQPVYSIPRVDDADDENESEFED